MAQPTHPRRPRKKSKTNWSRIFIIGLLGLALLAFILQSIPTGGRGSGRGDIRDPQFVDMGDLNIKDAESGESLAELDIEIARTRQQIERGLMWRRSMEENQGMLFEMDSLEQQSFWMLNTYIPLDIIYIDADRRIVSIAENTTPKSTDPIPSGAPALYVLEVNAGFAERHELEQGDRLTW